MLVDLSTTLPCPYDRVVALVKTPRLLQYVAAPMVSLTPVEPAAFPDTWTTGTYWVQLRLFGFLPFGKQAIVISMPLTTHGFELRDAGHSALIKVWHHMITVDPTSSGTLYRDRVEVRAGVLTPFIWAFAQLFYRHRQRRWKALASRGLSYGDA